MSYKITEEGNISTVFLNGEIDMDVTETAKEAILPVIDSGKEVHLNLKDVSYMDSSGISVLIESHQRALEKTLTSFKLEVCTKKSFDSFKFITLNLIFALTLQ